jgi:hypothetical protein
MQYVGLWLVQDSVGIHTLKYKRVIAHTDAFLFAKDFEMSVNGLVTLSKADLLEHDFKVFTRSCDADQ